jgi:uncharacterized membrane protein YvbJ
MKCPECGVHVRDTAKFCPDCGTRLKKKQSSYDPEKTSKLEKHIAYLHDVLDDAGINYDDLDEDEDGD